MILSDCVCFLQRSGGGQKGGRGKGAKGKTVARSIGREDGMFCV